MGIRIVSGAIYASEPSFMVDVGIFVAGSTGHLSWTEDHAPRQIIKIRQILSSLSAQISTETMKNSSMEPRGSLSTLPLCDRTVFSVQQTCFRCHRLLRSRFDEPFGGIVRNRVYNNPVKFPRLPMEESPAIYHIPEACRV